jgi:hypothetical protein
MWQRRISGRIVSSSPLPPITTRDVGYVRSIPEQANNGDVLSAVAQVVKPHTGGRAPYPPDVVSQMVQLRADGASLRAIASAVARDFRVREMPPMSVWRVLQRTTRGGGRG